MGLFDGFLLASDLDGTLIGTDLKIPAKNLTAIDWFCLEGGVFLLASGRAVNALRPYHDQIPRCHSAAIVSNGAGVYDYENERFLFETALDDRAAEVAEFVEKNLPHVGIEIYKGSEVYFCRVNETVKNHIREEGLSVTPAVDFRTFPKPWAKLLFAQRPEEIDATKNALLGAKFAGEYQFIKSASTYFEALGKNAAKGSALLFIAENLHIKRENIIAVGDNENDLSMLLAAGRAFAPENAAQSVKERIKNTVVSNDEGAVWDVIINRLSR